MVKYKALETQIHERHCERREEKSSIKLAFYKSEACEQVNNMWEDFSSSELPNAKV